MEDMQLNDKTLDELAVLLLRHIEDADCRRLLREELEARPGKDGGELLDRLRWLDGGEAPSASDRMAEGILSAWIAMEVLAFTSYTKPETLGTGNPKDVAPIFVDAARSLPWEYGNSRSKKNHRKFYQVFLGSIPLNPVMDELMKRYPDSAAERPWSGRAPLACVVVDEEGVPVDTLPAVSSFGWGAARLLEGGSPAELEDWLPEERLLKEGLANQLTGEGCERHPLTLRKINDAYHWLFRRLGFPEKLASSPSFTLCCYQHREEFGSPLPMLLNSFFIEDLAAAKQQALAGTLPDTLRRYLGLVPPPARRDLLGGEAPETMRGLLAPSRFPFAAWPVRGGHPLVLLQQCAVNAAMEELRDGGILAVNGPPGTGKTTLLRDIVAAVVTERARVMAEYDDPENAFRDTGKQKDYENGFHKIYQLDDRLRGFEILVASSNNKAVENISKELPNREAVDEECFGDGYFSFVSDALSGGKKSGENEEEGEDGETAEQGEKDVGKTWGLISAALGKSRNRWKFKSVFWDQWAHTAMVHYLKHAASGMVKQIDDPERGKVPPLIIEREKPPANKEAALVRWQRERETFLQILRQVEERLASLQSVHDCLENIGRLESGAVAAETELQRLADEWNRLKEEDAGIATRLMECRTQAEPLKAAYRETLKDRPWFFHRLLKTARHKEWETRHTAAHDALYDALIALGEAEDGYKAAEMSIKDAAGERERLKNERERLTAEYDTCRKAYQAAKAENGESDCLDDAYFERDHEALQTSAPWLDRETRRLRGKLFEAAMALHRAFIGAAASPIRHNCGVFFNTFGTKTIDGDTAKDRYIPHLWSTFFLLVPVVSTTFASAGKMLAMLGDGDLGWLLVDEAGQALPQAAVGTVRRARRAVVVGDPLQIEPVVPLPESLLRNLCRDFGVDFVTHCAPVASAQTLADRATAYGAVFGKGGWERAVGVPLLVHRRCADPMFSIANAIAYDGLMVHKKRPEADESTVRGVLGHSRWLNVTADCDGKWNPAEGETVLAMLRRMREEGRRPDVYIVTPFVDVQNGLRDMVLQSGVLKKWAKEPSNPEAWVEQRIGTVHTVQGREAEAVVFVLGASGPQQAGARTWAGQAPNLVNVAVTRAKEALYVVGCAEAWKSAGVFGALHDALDIDNDVFTSSESYGGLFGDE